MPILEKVEGSNWDQRVLIEANTLHYSVLQQLGPNHGEKQFISVLLQHVCPLRHGEKSFLSFFFFLLYGNK